MEFLAPRADTLLPSVGGPTLLMASLVVHNPLENFSDSTMTRALLEFLLVPLVSTAYCVVSLVLKLMSLLLWVVP
jgi:hypothetical protein